MGLFDYYLRYMTELLEGSRPVPAGMTVTAEDEEGRTRQITRHWFQLSGRWGRMVRMPSRRVNPNNSSCTTR